ncbi:MAG: OB-fold domain-containing protein [Spirochaetaceae bacterium]|nr:OB-fold domain-containing protein [Myxococcales bacterium]MCB9722743.1 OB-fold domain-containing protein [Spirochaetaceae bacterium]
MSNKKRVPAIDGWLDMNESDPHLLGYLDEQSGTYFFPKDVSVSAAPGFADAPRKEVALSNRGRLWSYTTNHYKPPEPYVSPEPFEPYTVAAVELTKERMVVLGQLADGIDPTSIEVGQEMQLVLATLYEDDENEYVVWKWKPVGA